MSFSSKTKNELCRIKQESICCAKAELMAILLFTSTIKRKDNNIFLKIITENASVARRIFNLVKLLYSVHTIVRIKRNKSQKHMHSYSLFIEDKESLIRVLDGLELISNNNLEQIKIEDALKHELIASECCKKAFIRGAFLGAGSIINPEKTYHFEFVTHYSNLGEDLCTVLNEFGLYSKTIKRKANYVIYFKGSEYIADLLNIMGAHKSLLQLENIRVMKEMRNNVNRIVNCETANLEKTVDASFRQIQNIELIQKTIGLKKLPKNLRDVAITRLEYKEASLKELGEMLDPPVGKSGVNHRLRKLQRIADNIREA